MCTSPIHIKNPKIDFSQFNDKVFLDVPCGKCEECKQNKILSFQIRSYYEYKFCVEKCNGCVYYYTLTFNNKCIPTVSFCDTYTRRWYRFPCFSRTILDNFKRNFKNCLKRSHPNLEFKIFIVSEYGGDTRRPHHHVIVFFYGQISPLRVKEIFVHSWIKETKMFSSTPLGNVKEGDNFGLVNSSSAIMYVTKYVGKSESYDDVITKVRKAYLKSPQYLEYIRSCRNGSDFVDETWKNIEKQLTPPVKKSRNFGVACKFYMSDIQKKYGTVLVENNTQGFVNVPLPLYLLRKFYYDTRFDDRGNVIYVLNPNGIERKLALTEKLIDKKLQFYEGLQTLGKVPKPLYEAFSAYTGFHLASFVDVRNYLDDLLLPSSPRLLFVYDLIYKGRPVLNFSLNSYLSDYETFLETVPFYPFADKNSLLIYDGLECFKNFNHALFILKLISTYFNYEKYLERYRKKVSYSRVLSVLEKNSDKIKSKFHPPKTLVQFSNLFDYEKM